MRSHALVRQRRHPGLAFALAALWPGLGQLYLREPKRLGLLLAIPPLALFLPLLLAALRGGGGLVSYLVVPNNALLLVVAIGLSFALRLLSLWLVRLRVGATATAELRRFIWGAVVVLAIVHLLAVAGAYGLFGITSRVFGANMARLPAVSTQPSSGTAPGASQLVPLSSPTPANEPDDPITVLLVGSDFGTGYAQALTDTMMVVRVDPVTRDVTMVSVPRDTARFEMVDGSTYLRKLNSLMTEADKDPGTYPHGGLEALTRQIEYLIGIPIPYAAYIDMASFERLIDVVGGVDIMVAKEIHDTFYQFPNGPKGFHLAAGLQHLNAARAVAYVRSRYGAGDNDFTRARRQQELLVALKDKLLEPATLPRLPGLLDEFGRLVSTNFPPERVGEVISLAEQIDPKAIQRFVLGPPYAIQPPGGGEYVLVPDMERIATWSIKLFGADSRYTTP